MTSVPRDIGPAPSQTPAIRQKFLGPKIPIRRYLFINHTHPSQSHGKEVKHVVHSFLSGAYKRRNRQIVLPPRERWKWTLRDSDDGTGDASKNRHAAVGGEREGKVPREVLVEPLADSRLGYPRADPFNSYPVDAQDCVPVAVDFYIRVLAPSQNFTYRGVTLDNPLISKLFPLALQNTELFEALITVSQYFRRTNFDSSGIPCKSSLFHRVKALESLRYKLMTQSRAADDSTIIATVFLMAVDYLLNEKAAYTIHLNGLNHMVASRGGLENLGLDGLVGAMALKIDYFSTLMTGLLPRYETPDHVSKRFRKTPSLPHWYQDLIDRNFIISQLLHTIETILTLVTCLERSERGEASAPELQILREYDPTLDTEIAELARHIPHSVSDTGSVEDCLGSALLIYILETQNRCPQPSGTTHRQTLERVAVFLSRFEGQLAEKEYLTWIFVLAGPAFTRSLWRDHFTFIDRFLDWFNNCNDWGYLQEMLLNYLWYNPVAEEWRVCSPDVWRRAVPLRDFLCYGYKRDKNG